MEAAQQKKTEHQQKSDQDSQRTAIALVCKDAINTFEACQKATFDYGSVVYTELETQWRQFSITIRIEFTDKALENHWFAHKVDNVYDAQLLPELLKATAAIPELMFIKIAKSHLGYIKVLIFGRVGTPFDGGAFT